MAERSSVSFLRASGNSRAAWRQVDGAGLVLLFQLPRQVHCPRRHAVRAKPYPAAQMATRNASGYRQQKGNVRPSTLMHAWYHV